MNTGVFELFQPANDFLRLQVLSVDPQIEKEAKKITQKTNF